MGWKYSRFYMIAASWLVAVCAWAAPPGADEPLLRIEAGGPTSYVTALAFADQGRTLYAGSFDKVVRVWRLDAASGRFAPDPAAALRVPIGPGLGGAINAMAISPDGNWLAVAGSGVVQGEAGFREPGLIVPTHGGMTPAMRADQGLIYLFDLRTRQVNTLRGHLGPVHALRFAPDPRQPAVLVSAAEDWDEAQGKWVGSVRAWDIAQRKSLRGVGLPQPHLRPDLVVRRAGPAAGDLKVFIAWDDAQLRVWDVRQGTLETRKDGTWNDVIADLSPGGAGPIATGSFGADGRGSLRLWTAWGRGGLQPGAVERFDCPAEDQVYFFPRVMAPVASRGEGRIDLLAAVFCRRSPPATCHGYELRLLDYGPRGIGAPRARVPLAELGKLDRMPTLAVSPTGAHLAVAGGADQAVRVYRIADLLAGQARAQTLRSVGQAFAALSFAQQGEAWGVLLRPSTPVEAGQSLRAIGPGDMLFDFTQRALVAQPAQAGWKPVAPDTGPWQVSAERQTVAELQAQWTLRITGPQNVTVQLPQGVELTQYALLPAGDAVQLPVRLPLLAVASHERGLPTLALYNAATGEQIRQYSGHTERIDGLAFAPDGRLLASVSADQTVCVWSLTDLDEIVGVHGMLPGVTVRDADEGVEVVHIDAARAGDSPLRARDRLAGVVAQEQFQPWTQAREFYGAFWQMKPGAQVVLRRQPQGETTVTVGQGIDERKPLFTLFFTEGQPDEAPRWIGWSPLGPFDASDLAAERLIGWHFNTGDPAMPVSFAAVGQYRDRYFRRGILAEMVARASLPPAAPDPPVERPSMLFEIPELGETPPTVGGLPLLRGADVAARLTIFGIPAEKIDRVLLEADGQELGAMEASEVGRWVYGPVGRQQLARGPHRLRAVLHTREQHPQQFSENLEFHYQPPAPALQWADAAPATVEEPAYTVQAKVAPGLAQEKVRVRLVHLHNEQPVGTQEWEVDRPQDITYPLQLRPGRNQIDMVAQNVAALAGQEEREQVRQVAVVHLSPRKMPPPRLDEVVLRAAGAGGVPIEQPLPVASSATIESAEAELAGSFHLKEGELPRIEVHWTVAGQPRVAVVAAPERDAEGKVTFTQRVAELAPGENPVEIRLSNQAGEESFETALFRRPPLPPVRVTAPRNLEERVEGRDSGEVVVEAEIGPDTSGVPYQTALLLDNEPAPVQAEIREGRLSMPLKLHRGENRIRLKLWNDFGAVALSEPVLVTYRIPPLVGKVEPKLIGDLPLADLTIQGTSATPITQIKVAGRSLPPQAIQYDATKQTWTATAVNVPLREETGTTKNLIEISAWNEDAETLQPAVCHVAYARPAPPKAELTLISPLRDASLQDDRCEIHFRARSISRFRNVFVELTRNEKVVYRAEGNALRRIGRDGLFEIEQKVPVQLEPGANSVRIVAANDGGEREEMLALSFTSQPVWMVIDALEAAGPTPTRLQPVAQANRPIAFEQPAPTSKVVLHGRVKWRQAGDKRLREPRQRIQVRVNGFQQMPELLAPPAPGTRERRFRATVVLSRPTDNVIDMILPDLEEDAGTTVRFAVDCASPATNQRLHLLVVGVGVEPSDERQLVERALAGIHAQRHAQQPKAFTSHAFSEGSIYGPLLGHNLSRPKIFQQLALISQTVETKYKTDPLNDVVMIYYEGGQIAHLPDGFVLTTHPPGSPLAEAALKSPKSHKAETIDSDLLTQFLDNTRGAHLLLLDIAEDAEKRGLADVRESTPTRAAILCYAWARGQRPFRATLMDAMRQAMPESATLSALDRELARQAASQPNLIYDRLLPEILSNVVLGP